ncbi:hypothetical protein BDV93DRAFT_526360 [Ceratobasidium sp. AG-I]|nr:hypothetical protein BDV93DRAFT_526360 [Ceratobasidium sp. AG-I]
MHLPPESDPARRSRLLSRILDPEYTGAATPQSSGSLRARSPSLADLPQASVFVDRWGEQHDPDFRPFGGYPTMTPAVESEQAESWPWDAEPPSLSPARRSSTTVSSSYYSSSSSGSRSRSISVLPSPTPTSPPADDKEKDRENGRPRISSPGEIPRAALFPWTPAQRAVRVQHEVARRNVPPPPSLPEEDDPEQEIPLSLVDSRYVPGYGHAPPPGIHRSQTDCVPSTSKSEINGRTRSHTVPVPACTRRGAENAEDGGAEGEAGHPQSPSCTQSLRQSVYSLGLKTKLGLYHMKVRVRSAARRPLSL